MTSRRSPSAGGLRSAVSRQPSAISHRPANWPRHRTGCMGTAKTPRTPSFLGKIAARPRLPQSGLGRYLRLIHKSLGALGVLAVGSLTISRRGIGVYGLGFVLSVFCVTCQSRHPANQDPPAAPSVAAQAATQPTPAQPASAAEPKPTSACAGQYQGTYTVAATKPSLSKKEGAPSQWEKDEGHALAGQGELTLKVDAQNLVSGSAKGALGQQTLRGSCDDNTLRIRLDATDGEPTVIQNAFIVADLAGDQATGTLSAATGDSLVRRSGAVNLRKTQ